MHHSRLTLTAVAAAAAAILTIALAASTTSSVAATRGPVVYSFITWGDMRPASQALHAPYSAGWRHVRNKMAATSHAFEIVVGDMVNVSATDSRATVNGKYADFFTALGTTRSIRKSYAVGNHEAVGASANAAAGWEANIRKAHYSRFSYGAGTVADPRIYVINLSTFEAGHLGLIGYYGEGSASNSPQADWLVSALRAHAWDANTFLVVNMHHPLADSKSGESYDTHATERQALEALFDKYGVDLVVAGHVHQYVRHMMPDGTPYIIQGMAGADPVPAPSAVHDTPGTDAVRIGSADSTHRQYGFTRFQVTTGGHLWGDTYVTSQTTWAWRVADTFEVKKQAPTAPAPSASPAPTPTATPTAPTPTPTATPTAPATVTFQPSAPYYATFFYPWYENSATDGAYSYWQDEGNRPPATWFSHYLPDPDPTKFDPASELYSSLDYSTFKWEVAKMAEARQEVAITSWFGRGTKQDVALSTYLNDFMKRPDNPYPNLRFALYYEQEGFSDPTVSQLVADLDYIKANFATSPYFLKVGGKPVIFVYGNGTDGAATSQRWKDAVTQTGNAFYYVLKVYDGYASDPNQPSSWHQYAPAGRYASFGRCSTFVSPGFWKDAAGETVRLPRDLTAFTSAVRDMVAAGTTWNLVETWNEWGEGSSVEPGQQTLIDGSGRESLDPNGAPFGNAYVRALADNLPALELGTGR